jgi:hypothetical protein
MPIKRPWWRLHGVTWLVFSLVLFSLIQLNCFAAGYYLIYWLGGSAPGGAFEVGYPARLGFLDVDSGRVVERGLWSWGGLAVDVACAPLLLAGATTTTEKWRRRLSTTHLVNLKGLLSIVTWVALVLVFARFQAQLMSLGDIPIPFPSAVAACEMNSIAEFVVTAALGLSSFALLDLLSLLSNSLMGRRPP